MEKLKKEGNKNKKEEQKKEKDKEPIAGRMR